MLLRRQFQSKIIFFALIFVFAFCFLLFSSHSLSAQVRQDVLRGECIDAFPNLISDICWRCLFPIRIGGQVVLNIGDMPDNVNTGNPDDFNPSSIICTCPTGGPIPAIGLYVSFWEPARVIEVVQRPYCFPFLFGLDLGDHIDLFGVYGDKGQGPTAGEKAFYNVHYYVFPLLEILDIFVGMEFCTDGLTGLDLAYFTEVDPLWNDDELTAFINPEAIVFANPIAQALCAVDCLTASASFPLNRLFWCAGCWGSMYPYTGNTGAVGSPVRTTSLLKSRLLARMARLPIPPAAELDTSSSGAKCGGQIRPIIKKSQYRFSTLFPIPQTRGRCCHPLGSSTLLWGEHRNIPATGEFQIYMMWRKRNCCLRIL